MEEVGEVDESSKDGSEKMPGVDTNESGIGVDLDISCDSRTLSDATSKLISVKQMSTSSTSPESRNQLSLQTDMTVDLDNLDASDDASLNCTGMKKDDSGIYSEKSPNCGLVKSVSDGDSTESITESFEENASLVEQRSKHSGVEEGEPLKDTEVLRASYNDRVEEICDNSGQTNEKDNLNANNAKGDSEKSGALNNNSVTEHKLDDISDKDTNNVANVIKPTGSKRTKLLVDYESSDSEKTASDASDRQRERDKPNKCSRKRKSSSSEDSDVDLDNDDDDDGGEANSDGTPVLLRHAGLEEPDIVRMSDMDSDVNSDASDAEVETKNESSESEPDDAPVELSRFGAPSHKWKALFDLRDRERGYSVRKDSGHFRKKIQGSLQMVQRFDLQYKMDEHQGCVNALHFNTNGNLLASGSDDLNIVIWDWIRNKPQLVYDSGHRSNVFQSKFMPFSGDCHVVSCARDGQIRLADLSSTGVCKGTKKLAQHRGAAHKLALEMDSPHVFLSCGEDAVTFEIDLRCEKANKLVLTKENDRKVAQYSIHSNPCNSNEFVVSGRDHFIRIYDKRKMNEDEDDGLLKKFCPHHLSTGDKPDMKANVTCACYNYNGTEVLGTYNDEDIYLFSNSHSDGANYIHKYTGHRNNQTVKGVNFYGPESEFIVSGSDCGHIFLWDKATENIVKYMSGDDGGVINVLEPHPFSPVLATSGLDHDVKIWAPTGESTKNLGLKQLIKRNSRERDEERSSDGGTVDGAMLWYLMHHLRRGRRRREREAQREQGESPDDDDDSSSESESDNSDSDADGDPRGRIQCAPS